MKKCDIARSTAIAFQPRLQWSQPSNRATTATGLLPGFGATWCRIVPLELDFLWFKTVYPSGSDFLEPLQEVLTRRFGHLAAFDTFYFGHFWTWFPQ